ncbi:peptidase inhibitor family I36 protein [Actinomyces respiraculi]|uniref:Peptidase inhibitor family I36 protein n=1 Tax=Actinomyces respiraculi TaxID=2744574 RepID=A0A7T0LJN9_9ACTO|nr:peptidase inhibitor family I36 protein [Actinomyces respiraculi]
MTRRSWGRVAVLAALPLTLMGMTGTAHAAQGDCGSGYTCMWEQNYDQEGGGISFQRYIPDLSLWDLTNGHGANDTISSVKNRGSYEGTCLFPDAYAGGYGIHLARGYSFSNLAVSTNLNDAISSAYVDGFASC